MEEDGTKKQVSSFYISGVEGGSVSFHFLGEKKKGNSMSVYLFVHFELWHSQTSLAYQ